MNSLSARVLAVASLVATLLAGCASPARIEQMQVDPSLAVRTALAKSSLKDGIAIKDVTGGNETNPAWISSVSSSDFERALEASLRAAGLLSANRQASPFTLVAHLLTLEQPLVGLNLTVTAKVQYWIVERAKNNEVYAQVLTTPYTAAFGDSPLAVERLRLANEGAMRANISRLIEDLAMLKVPALNLR